MNAQIAGTCPLCGSSFKFSQTVIDKKELIIDENKKYALYNGAEFILTHSIAALCKLYGMPYGLGKAIGSVAVDVVENAGAELAIALSDESRIGYLIEIKCSVCDYVVKRYYTDKIE